ncbi:MAG: hypothetical protein ACRDZ4_06910 [Egibacteraceae bacterium]
MSVEERGSSPLTVGRVVADDNLMDAVEPPPVTVRVVTTVPLLRGESERVARTAGVTIVPSDEAASITLRSADESPTQAGVGIVAAESSVTLTVHEMPDLHVWLRVRSLLRELLDGAG